ncbi:EamA family transporter [soil metagenome]
MTPRDILLALVPPLCWGVGFAIAKPAVTHFPPLFMMTLVYCAIALTMSLTARAPVRTPWLSLFLISLFVVPLQGILIFTGLRGLEAGVATLVIQIQVPFAVVLGWLVAGENLNLRKCAGTLVALAGVALVIGLPQATPPLVPVLLVIAGSLIWALGQVLARKLGRDSGLILYKGVALAGTPQLILATALFETGQWRAVSDAGPWDWAALGFVALVGFYLSYVSWFALLRRFRMDDVAPFTLLMPVTGLIAAALFLGEHIQPAHLIGGAVLIAGLAIVTGLGPFRQTQSA